MRSLIAFLALMSAIAFPAGAGAAPGPDIVAARAADAVAVLKGDKPPADVFTEEFLRAVPAAQIAQLAADLQAAHGRLTGFDELKPASPVSARFLVRFERAVAQASMQIDGQEPYKIMGLRITSVAPLDDGPQRVLADFAALPGQSGFAVVKLSDSGIAPVLSHRPAQQLAIGSAFKLWVLDALADEIEKGRLQWGQVVPINNASLSSGITHGWPKGSPATVHTLAALMISISDNTATDTLIHLIGRQHLEAAVAAAGHSQPSGMRPFLTTSEAFALKAKPADFAERYATSDEAAKRRILAGLPAGWDPGKDRDDLIAALATSKPLAIDKIEWFASPDDIARVFDSLRRRKDPRVQEILAIAPQLPEGLRARFAFAGYKGGSEAGVINLSWLLRAKSGEWYVVTASWNDPRAPVDNGRFEALALRLLGLIR